MKKNTVKLFIFALAFGGTITAFGQTKEQKERMLRDVDVEKLSGLSVKLSEEFYTKREKALLLAQENGWPVEIRENGGVSKLVDVTIEGKPLYYTTYNQGSAITIRTNHLHPGGLLGLDLTGAGLSVGVWDGDYPLENHVDFAGRFFSNDGPANPTAFHPTHVLGTVIGAGANDITARGMAYEAEGVIYDFSNDMAEMANQATFASLLVSNHSYGLFANQLPANYFGAYVSFSQAIDEITFGSPYYQPVFAAGNDNNSVSPTYDWLSARGTSKNGIVVAAIAEVPNYTGPQSVNIIGFSNWGPTDDNRIKPDISAKGQGVRSASNASPTSYAPSNGTSMAAPAISGTLLLLQEHFSNLNGGLFMRSATLRGLMAHTADEAGPADGPDAIFGWGLMNARRAAEAISAKGEQSIIEELVLLPGQTYTKQVLALPATDEPLIATLSWTDPARNVGNSIYTGTSQINNLDIKVTKNTQTFFPWKLGSSLGSAAIKGENNVDNIEKVQIDNASAWYTITISHKGATLVNPATGGSPSQQFSLIVTGVDATALSNKTFESQVFSVWPNPAKEQLNISLASGADNASVTMYDIQGRKVLEKELTDVENTLNVQNLAKGVYIVNVLNAGNNETKKIIIE